MSRKVTLTLLTFMLILGGALSYVFYGTFPEILLPESENEYLLIASSDNEILITRILFSIFCAMALASIPISALIANKFSGNTRYTSMVIASSVVMLTTTFISVLYYQNYFKRVFEAAGSTIDINIMLSTIPFVTVPLFSIGSTIIFGLLVLTVKKPA